MSQLFSPTLEEQIKEVEREIALRKSVYPRWIEKGKLKPDKAARQIETMEAVARSLYVLLSARDKASPRQAAPR